MPKTAYRPFPAMAVLPSLRFQLVRLSTFCDGFPPSDELHNCAIRHAREMVKPGPAPRTPASRGLLEKTVRWVPHRPLKSVLGFEPLPAPTLGCSAPLNRGDRGAVATTEAVSAASAAIGV